MAESTTRSRKSASSSRTTKRKPSKASSNSRASSNGARKTAQTGRTTKRAKTSRAAKKGRVEQVAGALGSAAQKAKVPALAVGAAAASVAGGVLLKRQVAPAKRKVLGVPVPQPKLDGLMPSSGADLKPIAKQVSKAGKRLAKAGEQAGKLSEDVQRAGKTAEKLGDSLS